MVAPKTVCSNEKSNNEKSSSPEPFQEPDGMMTIDLNKSDDFTKESDEDIAKLKKKLELKYLGWLLCVLGTILLVVTMFIIVALINKEYHLFTVIPLKVNNHTSPVPIRHDKKIDPEIKFLNRTKFINQVKFREKLISSNYLDGSEAQMNLCKIRQTIDVCCDVFRRTELYDLAEFCTVNDMLNILLEYEIDSRKKRQVNFDQNYGPNYVSEPEFYENHMQPSDNDYFKDTFHSYNSEVYAPLEQFSYDQYVQSPIVENQNLNFGKVEATPNFQNAELMGARQHHMNQNFDYSTNPRFDQPNHEPVQSIPPADFERTPSNIQSFLDLPAILRERIIDHVTLAPKSEENFGQFEDRYEDYDQYDPGRVSEVGKDNLGPSKQYELQADANGKFHLDNVYKHAFNGPKHYNFNTENNYAVNGGEVTGSKTNEPFKMSIDLESPASTISTIKVSPSLLEKNKEPGEENNINIQKEKSKEKQIIEERQDDNDQAGEEEKLKGKDINHMYIEKDEETLISKNEDDNLMDKPVETLTPLFHTEAKETQMKENNENVDVTDIQARQSGLSIPVQKLNLEENPVADVVQKEQQQIGEHVSKLQTEQIWINDDTEFSVTTTKLAPSTVTESVFEIEDSRDTDNKKVSNIKIGTVKPLTVTTENQKTKENMSETELYSATTDAITPIKETAKTIKSSKHENLINSENEVYGANKNTTIILNTQHPIVFQAGQDLNSRANSGGHLVPEIIANIPQSAVIPTKVQTEYLDIEPIIENDTNTNSKQLLKLTNSQDILRANSPQEDAFRSKSKIDSFATASEDVQSNQQSFVNPCFYPYMSPYMNVPALKVGSPQDSGFLRIVSVSQPKVQNQPMYVLNPPMYYGVPQHQQYAVPQQTVLPSYLPTNTPNFGGYNSPVQVSAPGGQFYMCNPIPTPTNNIAGIAGVEVRREAANLQNLMEEVDISNISNRTREATLICPLGEQSCLDNSKCIKNHHVCDSEVQCDDSSDEAFCSCKERVGKLRLCDGYCDCPDCQDEAGCFGCEPDEFSCDDWSRFRRSTCVPLSQRCDNMKQCEITGKDEMDCSILTDHIGSFHLSKISNSVGFLHRNYKGKWYPTCFGTELWAAQVCQVEAGPSSIIPKSHMTLTTDPYNGLFINILPNNEVRLVNTCVQDRAAFVECPPIYCGLRFLVNNPYRAQEVDTSIEDMLNDLERAYKVRESELERNDLDIGGVRRDEKMGKSSQTSLENRDNAKMRFQRSEIETLEKRHLLTQQHLEEVVENLERTFSRREANFNLSEILGESRVVGGRPSQPAAWPWLVSIYKNGIFHCGGVLINELWVITAAHCVDRFWQYYYEIQAGALRRFSYSPMDQRRWSKVIIPHEFYSKSNLRNDIALMKLSAPIRYNRYVRPICLPSETTAGTDYQKGPKPGTICTTVGWGATVEHGADPDHMREVDVPIIEHCKHKEDSDRDEICAGLSEGGKDACQGDSGGPLMCRNPNNPNQWYLSGIVSHGEGCARPNEPGVYTKVSRYIGWIAENTREDKFSLRSPLQKCPGFTCKGTQRCVTKKRRCDRIIDCLLADDELDCENHFRDIFKHSRRRNMMVNQNQPSGFVTDLEESLVPLDDFGIVGNKKEKELENGKNKQENVYNDGKDENFVGNKFNETEFDDIYFKCSMMLQVISKNKRCNKILDCEDGTDELNCTCADYIKNIDETAICDGISDCPDLSDEKNCVNCNKTEYTCRFSQKCIDISKRCDGVVDCPQNEDELNCASLTNGHTITIDNDNRPISKSSGIVTINHLGHWKPLCLSNSSSFIDDEPSVSTVICNLLGFEEYFSFHKYLVEDKSIYVTYGVKTLSESDKIESEKCKNCCDGLYINCSNISFSTTLYHKGLENVKELYFSPWTVAIFANGQYKCTGTLLDEYWIVTSIDCFNGITMLQVHFVAAVFGMGKTHLPVKGPYEQAIRLVESIKIDSTDILLLRLEKKVLFNRYIQATNLNVRRESTQKEKCFALGQDNENKIKFVSLSPLKNCLVGYRCFERKIEANCVSNLPWSGTVICDSRGGWYPAAVFSEKLGHCGFTPEKKYTSVKFYKNQIFKAMTQISDMVKPPPCDGFQCNLGECIPKEKVCDSVADCRSEEDESPLLCYEKEKECHLADSCVCPPTHLKCPTRTECIPKSSFCDRTNNCGDFEDEPEVCSCRSFLRLTNPSKICDGILHCMDRSDEDPDVCSCRLEDFQCGKSNKCVSQEMVCDGYKDCPNGEDEKTCLSLKTEVHEKTNAGEVMSRTAGEWHSGCFDLNYTTSQLEEICSKLGFSGGSANQLTPPHNVTTLTALRPNLDKFDVVWLRRFPGNKLKMRIRSGNDPYVSFVADKKCHRLFIACI